MNKNTRLQLFNLWCFEEYIFQLKLSTELDETKRESVHHWQIESDWSDWIRPAKQQQKKKTEGIPSQMNPFSSSLVSSYRGTLRPSSAGNHERYQKQISTLEIIKKHNWKYYKERNMNKEQNQYGVSFIFKPIQD